MPSEDPEPIAYIPFEICNFSLKYFLAFRFVFHMYEGFSLNACSLYMRQTISADLSDSFRSSSTMKGIVFCGFN
jgi:hypothetical protein